MLSFLRIYFLTCLLSDLYIYSFQNRPIPFPSKSSWRCFGFILCCGIFCYGCMFALLCLFQFFSTRPRDWLGRTSSKWLFWVGWDV